MDTTGAGRETCPVARRDTTERHAAALLEGVRAFGPAGRRGVKRTAPPPVGFSERQGASECPDEPGLNGIFVGDGGTLSATSVSVDGASTSLDSYKGCQHGIAIEVGSKTPAEVGHAKLRDVTVRGYEKNGPTVKSPGSTMSITGSTIVGEGASPYIAQNGIEVAWGGPRPA